MLDIKKTPRRVVKMASVCCVVTLALVATLLITGHAAPQRRAPRGASSHGKVDDKFLDDGPRLELESPSNSRPLPRGPTFQDEAKPRKAHLEAPKKYTARPPKETSKTPGKSTPIPPPNPQVYLLPTENVKLVFPDDDETVMAANLRALDEQLGRPSDLHAIILESGEDADTFSRALHEFQERTYNGKKVTEAQDPLYQQDLLQGQLQYQALLARKNKPPKRLHSKAHLQVMPPPHVYNQQPLLETDPFLLQQHPQQAIYRQHKETFRGHRRRRSLLESKHGDVPSVKKLMSNNVYSLVMRKTRSPDDESSEANSEERTKFNSDESDERLRRKPNSKLTKLSISPNTTSPSSAQDKTSSNLKPDDEPGAGPAKAPSITEEGMGTEAPETASTSDQKLSSLLALDVSSSVETDDLQDYPDEINGISTESESAEHDGLAGTVSPAGLMEADRDSREISSEAPGTVESWEVPASSEVSLESSGSVERSSETPESSEMSKESSSSVEKSSEAPESSESSKESSSSVEKSSEAPESSESSKESSRSVERSSETPDSSEMSKESSSSVERSSETPDSSEMSKESSSSVEKSSESPESSEMSKESSSSVEKSSETPESSEMSKESSSSIEQSSEIPDSSETIDSSEDSSETQNSVEKSSESPESSEISSEFMDIFAMNSEAPEYVALSLEYSDSRESSSESSSSSQYSLEDPASYETSSEFPESSESPESLEILVNKRILQSKTKQGTRIIPDLSHTSGKLSGPQHRVAIGSKLFASSEDSPEIIINFKVPPEMIDESQKFLEALSNLKKTKTYSQATEKVLVSTSIFTLNSESVTKSETNGIIATTALPFENSTDYDTTPLNRPEFPFSVGAFEANNELTDAPVLLSDQTEFFDSSENYVDSMETLQPLRFDKPGVLDDAVKNSMNGKKDFNMTEQYPSRATTIPNASDGQYQVQDLTAENREDQKEEAMQNEDSNLGENFAGSLHTTAPSKLSGKKEGEQSSISSGAGPTS